MQKSISVIPAKAGIQAPQMIKEDMQIVMDVPSDSDDQALKEGLAEESEEEKKKQYEALKERMTKAS